MADQDPRVSRWAGEDMSVALRVHLDPELFVFGSDDATRYVQECLDRLAVLEGSNVQAEAVEDWSEDDSYNERGGLFAAQPARSSSELSHHGRIVKRLMTFGGFQRTERGEFWVSRDDVLRLLEEEFGADAVEPSQENQHLRKSIANSDRDYWFERYEALTEALRTLKIGAESALRPDGTGQIDARGSLDIIDAAMS